MLTEDTPLLDSLLKREPESGRRATRMKLFRCAGNCGRMTSGNKGAMNVCGTCQSDLEKLRKRMADGTFMSENDWRLLNLVSVVVATVPKSTY